MGIDKRHEAAGSIRGFAKMTLDFSFKRVFGNEKEKGALIAFLNRMIGDVDIEEVQMLPMERLGLTASDRKAVFDIFCRDKDGTEFIVEMQCAQQKYFRDRALFYAGYPLIEQGRLALEKYIEAYSEELRTGKRKSGFEWDYRLKPVIFIGILNFKMSHEKDWPDDKYYSSYRLEERQTHEPMNENLRFIFIELERFNKRKEELEDMNDKWIYALKHMHEFESRPDELHENEFDNLFNLAKIATFTPGEIKTYLNDLIMERDYWNTLNYAKEVAIAEGKAKGKAEGKAEATAEAIRKMLAAGLKIDQVCAIMEMTREEIEGAM